MSSVPKLSHLATTYYRKTFGFDVTVADYGFLKLTSLATGNEYLTSRNVNDATDIDDVLGVVMTHIRREESGQNV